MMVIFKDGLSYANICATAIISVPGYIVVVLQALFSTPFNLPLCLEIHKCTLKAGICNSKVISWKTTYSLITAKIMSPVRPKGCKFHGF